MANHLKQLLNTWHPLKDELDWALATIIETDGSSYRKSGAMMMINSLGQYHGLLSGGCLESDIMRQARRCWVNNQNVFVTYDMREEEDIAWQLGIGCGGMVKIILQPVTRNHQYLALEQVMQAMEQEQACFYAVGISEGVPENMFYLCEQDIPDEVVAAKDKNVYLTAIQAPRHLAIFGGGVDAIPVVQMAAMLDWNVTVIDERTSYARASQFSNATQIIKQPAHSLNGEVCLNNIDAVVIMNHNVRMDAEALSLLQTMSVKFVGMLGPTHRTERVLEQAGLTREELRHPLANPIGLRLGGELPESIALSIVSEIHASLEGKDGLSISGILLN